MIVKIAIEKLIPSSVQPRKRFDEKSLLQLAQTILHLGLLEPLLVRKLENSSKFEIIAGERRWRAAQLAKLAEVPCIIKDYDTLQVSQAALIENTARENLNPIELAQAIARIIEQFGHTQEQLGNTLGMDASSITHLLRLLKLDTRVQELIRDKQLSQGHGKILAAVEASKQYPLALEALNGSWSVRQLEKVLRSRLSSSKTASPTLLKDPNIADLELKISDYLGAPIQLKPKKQQSGELVIQYANYEILEGILEKMGYAK